MVFYSVPFASASDLEDTETEIQLHIDFEALHEISQYKSHLGFSIHVSSAFCEMASKLQLQIPFHASCICDVDSSFGEVQQQQ